DEEATIVEVGEWTQNADGTVTLSITGTADQEYSLPIELTFQVNEAGALVIPGEPDGPFGEEGLTLAPAGAPDTDTAATETPALDLATLPDNARVYQSEVLPSASTPGLQITLILFADGTLEMVSDYQQPDQVVIELGTWAESDDGTVIVTLTGQLDRNYEAPVELAFTTEENGTLALVDEDGLLFGEDGLSLTPLALPGATLPDAAASEALTPTATSEMTGDATLEAPVETPPVETTVGATDTLTVETPPAAEAEVSPTVTEAVTSPVTATLTPPVTSTVTPTESAPLTATAEPAAGEIAAGEVITGDAAMMVGVPDGPFLSDLLVAADGSDFFQVAIFYPNGDLLLSSYFLTGEPPVVEVGHWAPAETAVTDTADVTDTAEVTDTADVTDTA